MSWAHDALSRADMLQFLEYAEDARAAGADFNYGIREHGKLVGAIELYYRDAKNRMARIGYWLDRDSTGRGVMTKSVRSLVQIAFDELEIHRIEIRCAPENRASRAIPERLGFTNEGTQRDVLLLRDRFQDLMMYSLLSSEHRTSR